MKDAIIVIAVVLGVLCGAWLAYWGRITAPSCATRCNALNRPALDQGIQCRCGKPWPPPVKCRPGLESDCEP